MKIFESVYGFENPNQPTQPLVLSFRWRPTWLSFTLALGRQEPAHLACNTAEIPTDRQSYCVLAWNAVNSIFDASTEEAVWSTACDSHAQRENDTGLVWKNKIQWRLRRWEWTELTELEFVGRGGGVSGWALCVCVCQYRCQGGDVQQSRAHKRHSRNPAVSQHNLGLVVWLLTLSVIRDDKYHDSKPKQKKIEKQKRGSRFNSASWGSRLPLGIR